MFWGPLALALTLRSPADCTVRLSRTGLYVDGETMNRSQAIALCAQRSAVVLIVDDDAPRTQAVALRTALDHTGLKVYLRGPIDDAPRSPDPVVRGRRRPPAIDKKCLENPLQPGC